MDTSYRNNLKTAGRYFPWVASIVLCGTCAVGPVCHAGLITEYRWTAGKKGEGASVKAPASSSRLTGTLLIDSSDPDVAAPGSVFSWDGVGLVSASLQGLRIRPGEHPMVEGTFVDDGSQRPSANMAPVEVPVPALGNDVQAVGWSSGGASSHYSREVFGQWDLVKVASVAVPDKGSTLAFLAISLSAIGLAIQCRKWAC